MAYFFFHGALNTDNIFTYEEEITDDKDVLQTNIEYTND